MFDGDAWSARPSAWPDIGRTGPNPSRLQLQGEPHHVSPASPEQDKWHFAHVMAKYDVSCYCTRQLVMSEYTHAR
jgi:hypothetical protein